MTEDASKAKSDEALVQAALASAMEKIDNLARCVLASETADKYQRLRMIADRANEFKQSFAEERLSAFVGGGYNEYGNAIGRPLGMLGGGGLAGPFDFVRDIMPKVNEYLEAQRKKGWADEVRCLRSLRRDLEEDDLKNHLEENKANIEKLTAKINEIMDRHLNDKVVVTEIKEGTTC